MEEKTRPTKKQKELLEFIEKFIAEKGYSPSYREIMNGLSYNSVATVSLHINNLIKRGHLIKRDHSARSLELANPTHYSIVSTNTVNPSEEKWLIKKIDHFFKQVEQASNAETAKIDELYVLVGTLRVFALDGAASGFLDRLNKIVSKPVDN
jgi:repressor LexA